MLLPLETGIIRRLLQDAGSGGKPAVHADTRPRRDRQGPLRLIHGGDLRRVRATTYVRSVNGQRRGLRQDGTIEREGALARVPAGFVPWLATEYAAVHRVKAPRPGA